MTEIVAEIAQAHDGSLGILHSYIEALAQLDIDAIKFQTHIAAAESSKEEQFRKKFSYLDESRYEYWQRMEFGFEEWVEIKKHCEQKNAEFLSSPFSNQAVDLLEKLNVKRYKVGSGDINNILLLDKIAQTKKPIILSSGLSDLDELDVSIQNLQAQNIDITLLQCTSKYPTQMQDIGINLLEEYREKYNVSVGLSDHSGSIYPALTAAAYHADLIEVHVVFDNMMFGPDSTSSLTINDLKKLIKGVRVIEEILANPLKKDNFDSSSKEIFGRSLCVNKALSKGDRITFSDLEAKKPAGLGIHPSDYKSVLSRAVNQDLVKWQFLSDDLFND